jgi:hypothetical protein
MTLRAVALATCVVLALAACSPTGLPDADAASTSAREALAELPVPEGFEPSPPSADSCCYFDGTASYSWSWSATATADADVMSALADYAERFFPGNAGCPLEPVLDGAPAVECDGAAVLEHIVGAEGEAYRAMTVTRDGDLLSVEVTTSARGVA